ncbi:MAG: lysozyme inhibitor LprI family protein [Bacteroidia bacterium]
MKQIISTLFLIFFLIIKIYGQDKVTEKYPIDIKLEKCLSIDSNYTTLGMVNCTLVALDEWDKEMNKYYKLLIGKLNEDEKEKLKNSQKEWLAFRDKEIEFSNLLYDNMQGTMWHISMAMTKLDLTKQRSINLKIYFDTITFDK